MPVSGDTPEASDLKRSRSCSNAAASLTCIESFVNVQRSETRSLCIPNLETHEGPVDRLEGTATPVPAKTLSHHYAGPDMGSASLI